MDHTPVSFIPAKKYLDPDGVVLVSAELLANAVVHAIQQGQTTVIDFDGMPAVSSSFFNLIFRRVLASCAPDALSRVSLNSSSATLIEVFERSRRAVMKELAA